MPYKLAFIDDHPLVREGLASVFARRPEYAVVGLGGSADEAVLVASETSPDLMFIDVNMPGTGLAATQAVCALSPAPRVIMFSIRRDLETVRACFAAGASGYVVKGVTAPQLRAAAEAVLAGGTYVDPSLQGAMSVAPSATPSASE